MPDARGAGRAPRARPVDNLARLRGREEGGGEEEEEEEDLEWQHVRSKATTTQNSEM